MRRLGPILALVAVLSLAGLAPRNCSPIPARLLGAETAAPESPAATPTPAVADVGVASAATATPSASETAASGVTVLGALSALWTAANTDAGLALIASVVAWLLARLWTVKPEWKTLYDNYRGLIIQAVKFAEKEIPDGTENLSALRLDAALKYLAKLDAKLSAADQAALAQAINVVHSEAETNENI